MAKRTPQQKRRILQVVNAPALGPVVLRRYSARGMTAQAAPRPPATVRQAWPTPKKSDKGNTGAVSAPTEAQPGLTAADILPDILASLQSGPLRQAVEAIAAQVYQQAQRDEAGTRYEGGAYQRQGGF